MATEIRYCERCEEETKQRYLGDRPRQSNWSCIDCTVKADLAAFGSDDTADTEVQTE